MYLKCVGELLRTILSGGECGDHDCVYYVRINSVFIILDVRWIKPLFRGLKMIPSFVHLNLSI